VRERTRKLWAQQDRHPGDRRRLFRAVATAIDTASVLYPGSYVDIAPSFVFPSVTYVDSDARAAEFFADERGVLEVIASHAGAPADPEVAFLHADYRSDLRLPEASFDLLVSLYAGFISEHCARYLRIGGTLLANPSHGDVAMASIDPRFRLAGVILARAGDYRVATSNLDDYLVQKSPMALSPSLLHERGRGVAYTKSAFAYLFERVS
jgi:hypothetical protein